jgi:V/A-type H+-transporting ATPase subunit A
VAGIMAADTDFPDKDTARAFFQALTQVTKDWNRVLMESAEFGAIEERLEQMLGEVSGHA